MQYHAARAASGPPRILRGAVAHVAIGAALTLAGCGEFVPHGAIRGPDDSPEPRTGAAGTLESDSSPGPEDAGAEAAHRARVASPRPAPARPPAPPAGDDLAVELATLRSNLVVPVAGVQRSQLRDSYDEGRGTRVHRAMDILAPRGTPVLSAADGRVLKLFDSGPGGLMVYATDISERFILVYGHMDGYANGLRDGTTLVRGQPIGSVGTTGNAPVETPHLHFEVLRGMPAISWWEGNPVNPYPLLAP